MLSSTRQLHPVVMRLPLFIAIALILNLIVSVTVVPVTYATESQALIVNGSFEEPAVSIGGYGYFYSIPGWTRSSGYKIELQNHYSNWAAAEGAQFTELDSTGSTGIYQDIATQPGMTYRLRFAFSPRPGTSSADNKLVVKWNGAQLGNVITGNGSGLTNTAWTYYEFIVTASGATTRLEFRDCGWSNSLGTFVDDVSLTPLEADNASWVTARTLSLAPDQELPDVSSAAADQLLFKQSQSAWYKFSASAQSKVILTLTNLPANYDLTVYKDIAAAYRQLNSTQDLVQLGAEFAPDAFSPDAFSPDAFSPDAFSPDAFSPDAFSPDAFSPDAFSPDAFSPDAFSPDAFSPDAFSPDAFSPDAFSPDAFSPDAFSPDAFGPFAPDAFSSAQTRSLIGVSAFEGTAGEGIIFNTWDNAGDFYIRVRGRNGAFNTATPFHLEVRVLASVCSALDTELPASSLAAAAGGYKTLILTDMNRLIGSADDKSTLQTRLATFAARPEVAGAIVDVGADARVAAANVQADAHPECVFAKNQVAFAVKDIVDAYRALNPALEYIVIVGNDDAIPFFRHPDQALLASEKNYVPPVRDATASQASLKLGYVLSQDRYGAKVSISLKDDAFPIADAAVGRLVETADDATVMLDAYLSTSDGVMPTPHSALVTGYDFLEDAAHAVEAELEAGLGAQADTLIAPRNLSPLDPAAWTAGDLRTQLLGSRHDLIFLAGHFSANTTLAADYTTRLYTSDLIASNVNLTNALIFSAGCHSGYNIVDTHDVTGVTREPDWGQAFARKGATLIAGTGYQYGDTDFIEYSERLYLEFSRQLRYGSGPVSIGKALVAAKQEYLSNTPQMRGIHEKSLLEATLFGLPMLKVNLPTGRLTPPSDASIVSATNGYAANPGLTLGLQYADVNLIPTLTQHDVQLDDVTSESSVTATFFSGANGIVANPAEPVLPLEARNVDVPSLVLRGVGFRGGHFTDVSNVLPLIGASTTEIRGVHAPFVSDVFYPVRLWNANYFDALASGAGATRLMVTPVQLQSIGNTGLNTLRRFNDMSFRLFYSNNTTTYPDSGNKPALSAPPSISRVMATSGGGNVTFAVRVTGDPAAGIQEVWITYSATSGPFAGQWQSLNLQQNASDSTLWGGVLALGGTAPQDVRYMVQAVNGVGLVTLATNLGAYYVPDIDPGSTPPQATPTQLALQTPPTTGAYGNSLAFTARLTSNGTPLADQRVTFALGSIRRQGVTNSDGFATVNLPLLSEPDAYELIASFAGTQAYRPSSDDSPFTITRQATQLTLSPQPATSQYSDDALIAKLLDANGVPLREKSVVFIVNGTNGSAMLASITDFLGRAPLSLVTLPAGSYSVNAYFSGNIPIPGSSVTLSDDRYLPSSTTGSLTVNPEDASIAYTGETAIPVGTTLDLAAVVTQANDGAPGDITLAQVRYDIVDGNSVVVATAMDTVDANGNSSATIDELAVGTYQIRATVVGNFFASPTVTTQLSVYPLVDCSAAVPSVPTLWEPYHKFRQINVLGVTAADGGSVSITIDSIFQDEPVIGKADGRGIGTSTAEVLSERDGNGNGRVYHIFFTARSGSAACSGEVKVSVPHDQDSTAIDDGALYDSTQGH